MALPYRAQFLLADDDDAVRVASEQFRGWLKDKSSSRFPTIDRWEWDSDGVHPVGPYATLHVVTHVGEDGGRRQLLELRETNDAGEWVTRLVASSLPNARRLKQALWITLQSGDGLTPKAPGLPRRILEATDVWSGNVPITAQPRVITGADVDDLHAYLIDDDRDLSLVVAAPVGVDVDTWRDAVAGLVWDSVGTASAYVLDSAAFDELNRRLPETHAVPRGSVRTYLPGLDLEESSDSRRHRVLGPATMSRAFQRGRFSSWLVDRHSRVAREHLARLPLPAELQRVEAILEKLRLEQLRRSSVPEPVAVDEFSTVEAVEVERHADLDAPSAVAGSDASSGWLAERMDRLLRRFALGDKLDGRALDSLESKLAQIEIERARASAQIDKLLDRANVLASERDALRLRLEDEQLEREIAEQDRRSAESRYRAVLRWKNEQQIDGYIPETDTAAPWESEPESVRELVMRFDSDPEFREISKYIVLTDIAKAYDNADDIDERDTIGKYGAAFWEYVLVLRDYVLAYRAGFSGGVHDYLLADQVVGRKCSAQRHKPKESEQVAGNTKWRKARVFPVPAEVHEAGEVYMDAHFAPTHRDQTAPRMHYFADVAGSGKVYIGYIGRHLPNTKTN